METGTTVMLRGPVVILPLEEYQAILERLESIEELLDNAFLSSPALLQELNESRAEYQAGEGGDYEELRQQKLVADAC
jgi:PHD/YefM family antitoxin component YafN of YafNO toxin-antitoxin module